MREVHRRTDRRILKIFLPGFGSQREISRRRIVKSLISYRGRLSSLNNKIFVRFDSFKQSLFFR